MLHDTEKEMEVERNLMFLAEDRDPRMRSTAVQGLEVMCSNNKCLSLSCYKSVTKLCDDTDKKVRLSALRIVLAFAEKYSDHNIKNAKGFSLRIQDDAFAVVCHAVNDLEAEVRAEAAKLLGCFTSVSDSFLHQTLDKKLMRQMRMLGEETTAAKAAGGWSTGKKLGEDVPMEKDDEESQSLIPTGACGAFVTALEDEFMAVRQAAVYSLGRLARDRKDFARMCIDHLADMFNDEIQEVRLDAIRSLAPLVSHGILQQDQLHTILTVLDDAAAENRMAIHELIAKSNLADAECVRQCIRVLLHSLKRFPLDKFSIYQCLSAVGLKHSLFVHGLVTELLEIHPIFDTPEQHIDDDFYLGKLILVLNAASRHPVICSLIPAYVKKHYRYLRCSSPHLIPIVKGIEESKSLILAGRHHNGAEIGAVIAVDAERADALLETTYDRVVDTNARDYLEKAVLFDMILRDLRAFQNVEEEIAVPAGFLHYFCVVLRLYDMTVNSARMDDEPEPVHTASKECLDKILWIENQFSGVNGQVLACLQECYFRIFLILEAVRLDADPTYGAHFEVSLASHVKSLQRHLMELEVTPSESLESLTRWLAENVLTATAGAIKDEFLVKQENRPLASKFSVGQRLLNELGRFPLGIPKKIPDLKKIAMKSIKVIDPSKDFQNDAVIRFVAGLPAGILVSCLLSNLSESDLQRFRIQIRYPDQTISYFRPKQADFHRISAHLVRLHTTVVVSAAIWAEPANLQLVCGIQLAFKGEVFSRHQPSSSSGHHNNGNKRSTFVPLPDADQRSRTNRISVKVHPMQRA